MRMHGHAAHDDMKYVPKKQVEEWRAKDPIVRQVRRLEALGADVQAVRDEVKATIDAAVDEAMNWAGVQKLPIIFVLENNQYAYSTPVHQQFAVNPVERAAAYGFPGESVDGNDAEAMFEGVRKARERALAGEGPTLIEAVTMRMHGHAAHDDMKYVPAAKIDEWKAKDPIDRQERRLTALGVDVAALREEVTQTIDAAVEEALAMPMPGGDTATERVFADEPALLEDGNGPWSGFAASNVASAPAGLTGTQEAGAMAVSDEPEGRGAVS